MQEKSQKILFFFLMLVQIVSAKNDILLKKAAQLYDNEDFIASKKLYDSLYKMGDYDKNILEKLVEVSEKNNQPAEAIYFLRKIAQEYGGKDVEKRINSLIEELDYRHGVTIVENNSFVFWLKRNKYFFIACILVGIAGGAYCMQPSKRQMLQRFAYIFFLTSALFCFLMIYTHLAVSKQAILIHPSGFYQQPAYASPYQSEIFAPGSILEITDEQDIWYKIKANDREFWLPKFRVRVL